MRASENRKTARRVEARVLVLLLLLFAGTLAFRYLRTVAPVAAPAEEALTTEAPLPPTGKPANAEATSEPPVAESQKPVYDTLAAEPAETSFPVAEAGYNERSYQLVNDMVYTYQHQQEKGLDAVRALVAELKEENEPLGVLWERIMDYWVYVNTDLVVHPEALPDGLPEDDSLCIVVLGFQLEEDGSMAPELLGRCEVALAGARKYPNAYVAVTGGGTAARNTEATEAGVMAAWFLENGLAEERLIVEDASLTTDQNAEFTSAILIADYPQIKSLAIVSSDYHIPLGSLMFEEAALLYASAHGAKPYSVISNAAYATPGQDYFTSPRNQAPYVWFLAGPSYGN